MYARGMTTREIGPHPEEIYGVDISPKMNYSFFLRAASLSQMKLRISSAIPKELFPLLSIKRDRKALAI